MREPEQHRERRDNVGRQGKPWNPSGCFAAPTRHRPERKTETHQAQHDRRVESKHEQHAARVVTSEHQLVEVSGRRTCQKAEHASDQKRTAERHDAEYRGLPLSRSSHSQPC